MNHRVGEGTDFCGGLYAPRLPLQYVKLINFPSKQAVFVHMIFEIQHTLNLIVVDRPGLVNKGEGSLLVTNPCPTISLVRRRKKSLLRKE